MNIEMIRAAADRLAGHVRHTPLLNSPFLDDIAGRRVLIKPECLQHTGSFKFRGGWSAVTGMRPKGGVIAYSSGNHAQGVAAAARAHGLEAVIVMPANAPRQKIDNTRALGAEVVTYDRATGDRDHIGQAIAAERGLTLIKPFDEPFVVAGQGTTGLEIADQIAAAGVTAADVLIPCGGGGLASGIALALEASAPGLRARPVEPEGFDDTVRSLAAGHRLTNATAEGSNCDAILTSSPGEITFPIMLRLCGPGIAVSDHDCLRAMAQAFERLKIVIEPGGATALAAALFRADTLTGDTVIVVASGGNVGSEMFARALATL